MFVPRTTPLPRSTAAPDPRSPLVRHNTTNTDKNTKAALSPSSDTMRQIPTKTPKPRSSPRPTQCDSYRQKRKSRALLLDRHNATNIDKNTKAAHPLDRHNTTDIDKNTKTVLFPSSDTIRQIPTKTLKPHSPPRPTKCDSYRQNAIAALSPSSDIMRQISTKTPKPRSPLVRQNATVIDKNAIAELSPRPTQYDKYRQKH